MITEPVKGFRDYTGEEAKKREKIREILVKTFSLYGFEPAETPVIEREELVKGENASDETVSDIFKLQDKGKRNLALRYEFTFQLKRLAQNRKLPYKRFSIGYVFRDEPVTGNRFRQFTQCDIDTVGSSIKDEAEILVVTSQALKKLGIEFTINFNNRKLLNEILDGEGIKDKEAVLREIDKLDKLQEKEILENLKRYNAEKVLNIFKEKESFFRKYENYREIEELKRYCSYYGVKIEFLPSLARGLSYYNGSIFEVKSKIKETITAGGSYLINGIQSTGISFGLERLSLLTKAEDARQSVLIISIGQDAEAINLGEELRKNFIPAVQMYGKPSKALEYANSCGLPFVLFVGEDEIKKKKFKLKDMATGKEEFLSIKEVISKLRPKND